MGARRFWRRLLCRSLVVPYICSDMCPNRNFEVSEGSIRLGENVSGNYQRFLAGVHRYEDWYNPWTVDEEMELTLAKIIKGPLGLVTVPPGNVGLCFDQGNTVLLPPGMHQWNSITLQFVDVVNIAQPVVQLGQITIVNVEANYAAVTQNNGVMHILEEDHNGSRVHILAHQNWQFQGFLSMKIQTSKINVQAPTRDQVMMDVDANVVWRIPREEMQGPDGKKLIGTETAARWAFQTMCTSRVHGQHIMDTGKDMSAISAYVQDAVRQQVRGELMKMPFLNHVPDQSGKKEIGLEWKESIVVAIKETNAICKQMGVEVIKILIVSARPRDRSLMGNGAMLQNAENDARINVVSTEGDARQTLVLAEAHADAEAVSGRGKKKAADAMAAVQDGLAVDLEKISRVGEALNGDGKKTFFFGGLGMGGVDVF